MSDKTAAELLRALELADGLLQSAEVQHLARKSRLPKNFAKVCKAVRFAVEKFRQPEKRSTICMVHTNIQEPK